MGSDGVRRRVHRQVSVPLLVALLVLGFLAGRLSKPGLGSQARVLEPRSPRSAASVS